MENNMEVFHRMKFLCSKTELSEAISRVLKAVPQKSTIQALEGIKVKVSPEQVELTAYNLEMGIKTTISATTRDNCEFVASARLFSEFTKKMNADKIEIEIDESNIIKLSSDSTECSFSAIPADEYPDLPIVDSKKSFSVSQTVLKSMINMTSYAVSQNENKPIFTGELFDIEDGKFTLVAIDGFRLAIRTENIETKDKFHFVVPKKALQEVSTLLHEDEDKICTISINERHIIFEINGYFVISRLLEGTFHNYKLSIPNSSKTEILINKKDFINCLERCSLIIDDKNKSPIKCEVSNGELKINCKTSIGRVNDSIKAGQVVGEGITIGFNNKLVLEALKAAEGDIVKICFNGATKVIEFLPPEGKDYIFLVMPIQLKN